MKELLIIPFSVFYLLIAVCSSAESAATTKKSMTSFKGQYRAIDVEINTLLKALETQYKKNLLILKDNYILDRKVLYEKHPNVFDRSKKESKLNRKHSQKRTELDKSYSISRKEVNILLSNARGQLIKNGNIDPAIWNSISGFDTSGLTPPGMISLPTAGSGSLPASSGTSDGGVVSVPPTTNVPPIEPPTTPAGSDLGGFLPPQESLGDRVIREENIQDQMRLREQLFRNEQERKRRAEAEAAERERLATGFLGQNRVSGQDCNDSEVSIHPGATEICNYVDDDCDGTIDENSVGGSSLQRLVYMDRDGDLHGDPTTGTYLCPQTTRDDETGSYMTIYDNDCDDTDPSRWNNCTEGE